MSGFTPATTPPLLRLATFDFRHRRLDAHIERYSVNIMELPLLMLATARVIDAAAMLRRHAPAAAAAALFDYRLFRHDADYAAALQPRHAIPCH